MVLIQRRAVARTGTDQHPDGAMAEVDSVARCWLLELPPELRLAVYNELWTTTQYADYYISESWFCFTHNIAGKAPHIPRADPQSMKMHAFALPITCKALYQEAFPAFCSSVHFHFLITAYNRGPKSRRDFLFSGDAHFMRYVRSLSVRIEPSANGTDRIEYALANLDQLQKALPEELRRKTLMLLAGDSKSSAEQVCDIINRVHWPGRLLVRMPGRTWMEI